MTELAKELLLKAKELLGEKCESYELNGEMHICCAIKGGMSEPCHWIEDDVYSIDNDPGSCIAGHLQEIQRQRHALIDIVDHLLLLLH